MASATHVVMHMVARDASLIWPKLANDVVIIRRAESTFFRSDGGTFVARGADVYELVQQLAPLMTGMASLEEIAQHFPPAVRPRIERVIYALRDRGIVRNDYGRHVRRLPACLRTHFGAQLSLIEHLADAPEARFDRFRRSRVLLVGSGVAFQRCAAALVRNGLARL